MELQDWELCACVQTAVVHAVVEHLTHHGATEREQHEKAELLHGQHLGGTTQKEKLQVELQGQSGASGIENGHDPLPWVEVEDGEVHRREEEKVGQAQDAESVCLEVG